MNSKILGLALIAVLVLSMVEAHSFSGKRRRRWGTSSSNSDRCGSSNPCDYPLEQSCVNRQCVCDSAKCSALGKACKSGVDRCVDCISDGQCLTSPLTHCLTTKNKCVQCYTSAHCTDPDLSVCYNYQCVQCRYNSQCTSTPLTKCDFASKTCICQDSACSSTTQYCSQFTASGVCVQCRADQLANCNTDIQTCQSNVCTCDSNTCKNFKEGHGLCTAIDQCDVVQCLDNGNCPTGSICDTTTPTNTCVCDATSCPTGTCVGGLSGFCSGGFTCTTQGSSAQCGDPNYVCVDVSGTPTCQPNNIQCKLSDGTGVNACPTGTKCLSDPVFIADPLLQYADVCVPIVTSPIQCLAYVCPDGYSNVGGATVTDGTDLFCSCTKAK